MEWDYCYIGERLLSWRLDGKADLAFGPLMKKFARIIFCE
jgi:hypothetical protein